MTTMDKPHGGWFQQPGPYRTDMVGGIHTERPAPDDHRDCAEWVRRIYVDAGYDVELTTWRPEGNWRAIWCTHGAEFWPCPTKQAVEAQQAAEAKHYAQPADLEAQRRDMAKLAAMWKLPPTTVDDVIAAWSAQHDGRPPTTLGDWCDIRGAAMDRWTEQKGADHG